MDKALEDLMEIIEEEEGEEEEGEEEEGEEEEGEEVSHEKLDNSKTIDILNDNITELSTQEARLGVVIENLKAKSAPSLKDFNSNLEEHLSEDEWDSRLEDDLAPFFDAVEKAKEKYIKENTDTKDLTSKEEELSTVQNKKAQVTAVKTLTQKYADFDFKKVTAFYKESMTGAEIKEIQKSKTLEEGLEKIYKKMDKTPIKKTKIPKNIDGIRKRPAKGGSVSKRENDAKFLRLIGLGTD